MPNFNLLERSLGLVSPRHFVYNFQEKCSSFYILFTDQILFFDWLYFLRYCVEIICCPVGDVINLEINISFLIKQLPCKDQNFNILRTYSAQMWEKYGPQ